MLLIILCSSVQLALENPLNDPDSSLSSALKYIDISLTVIFSFEALLKIIAYGFVFCGSTSYILNIWNVLDFLVVIFSVMILLTY
jgi:voltage-dependent calcium channel L type alpha-1D